MPRFTCSVIAASLLLTPLSVVLGQNQQVGSSSPQFASTERPSACEHVRITLNSGRKIDADSYTLHDNTIEISRKGANQTFANHDIKRIEVRQGSCRDTQVTLKTGERFVGYLSRQTSERIEIKHKGKVLSIANSDIKIMRDRDRFRDKLITAALIPLMPVFYLIIAISCRSGCEM